MMFRAPHLLPTRRPFLLAALLLAAGCEFRSSEPVTLDDLREEHEPVEEVWNAAIRTSEGGRPRIHIEAPVMRTFETADSTFVLLERDTSAQRVVVRLFDEDGAPTAVIHADRVIRRESDGTFEARGNVEAVNVEGRRLESEELRWEDEERLIRSGGFVRIRTDTEHIEGYALEATEDLSTYRLERVTGQVTLREEE